MGKQGKTQNRGYLSAKMREIGYRRSARQILNPHRSETTAPVQNPPRDRAANQFDAFSLEIYPRFWVKLPFDGE